MRLRSTTDAIWAAMDSPGRGVLVRVIVAETAGMAYSAALATNDATVATAIPRMSISTPLVPTGTQSRLVI